MKSDDTVSSGKNLYHLIFLRYFIVHRGDITNYKLWRNIRVIFKKLKAKYKFRAAAILCGILKYILRCGESLSKIHYHLKILPDLMLNVNTKFNKNTRLSFPIKQGK